MATLTVPVGGFFLFDLFDAVKNTALVSVSLDAKSAVFKYPGDGSAGITIFGTGLTFDLAGNLTAGTITGVDYIGFEGSLLWSMRGLTGFTAAVVAAASIALDGGNEAPFRALLMTNAWNVTGSVMNDEIIGGNLNDILRGGLGNDVFVGHNGADLIIGGPHTGVLANNLALTDYDTVDYSRETGLQGITVDFDLITGQVKDTFGKLDTLKGIEHIIGTARADIMLGSSTTRYEIFTGGNAADLINGRGGVSDEVRYDRETGSLGVIVDLDATSATQGTGRDTFGNIDTLINIERVSGTMFSDEIRGNGADNTFTGLKGADILDGGLGNDGVRYDLDEGFGDAAGLATFGVRVNLTPSVLGTGIARDGFKTVDTLISIENVLGTDYSDRIVGSAVSNILQGQGGADYLSGLGGNDTLRGGNNADHLLGGAGIDQLFGDYGSDVLNGGAGSDTLTGGFGYDIYAFTGPVTLANLGTDTIMDFEDGLDVIDLSGLTAALTGGPDPVTGIASLTITDVAGGAQVALVADPTVFITVKGPGILAASLSAVDFVF